MKVLPYKTIEPGTCSKEVSEKWEKALIQSLATLCKEDKAVCLIPLLEEDKGKKIYSKSDLPDTFKK